MIKQKILWVLLWIFLIIITLIHSQLFIILWVDNFLVSWNYEYTKVILFNIILPVFILTLFIVWLFNKIHISIPKNIIFFTLFFYIILWISTYFSAIPFQSLFWWVSKWHWFIYYNNLILFFLSIYILFQNIWSKYILKSLLFPAVLLSIAWIKEYYLPSYNYWDLWNRLISTLWHPNYVAWVLVMIIPYSISFINNKCKIIRLLYIFISILLLFTLVLTKSFIAIFLIILYIIYEFLWKNNIKLFSIITALFAILWWIFIFKYFPEKLNSFVSRFYIWETTLKIICSDIKIFFFWIWAENLKLYFDNFKSIELYLYENIWFNADRPHNILLNFWAHFWIFWLIFISWIYYKIIKSFNTNNWWNYSLLWISIFWLFNFPNIIWYLFFIIIFTYWLSKNKLLKIDTFNINIITIFLFILLFIITLFWSFYSYKSYIAETLVKQNKYSDALEIFPYYADYYYNNYKLEEWLKIGNNFYSENYYLYNIYFSLKKTDSCKILVSQYPSIENYFYCGQLVENKFWFYEADYFYKKWIELFPNIWNNNNEYLNTFPWKYIINSDRILHPKYSNIQEILRKIELNKIK
jgi:hypothetical protein